MASQSQASPVYYRRGWILGFEKGVQVVTPCLQLRRNRQSLAGPKVTRPPSLCAGSGSSGRLRERELRQKTLLTGKCKFNDGVRLTTQWMKMRKEICRVVQKMGAVVLGRADGHVRVIFQRLGCSWVCWHMQIRPLIGCSVQRVVRFQTCMSCSFFRSHSAVQEDGHSDAATT